MEQFSLGQLPEGFSHLSKFRPADLLDFSRRAKTMAKVLQLPLQEAQTVLARAYGYANLHELHQILKEPGACGPYQDQLGAIGAGTDELAYNLRFYRDDRLARYLANSRLERDDPETADFDVFACDLGLFSSPTAHRAATRSVLEFLESGKGFTQDGFPFGYNGVLHTRYRLARFEIDEKAWQAFITNPSFPFRDEVSINPAEQLRLLRSHRASYIFTEMVKRAAPELLNAESEISLVDVMSHDAEVERLLIRDYDDAVERHVLRLAGMAWKDAEAHADALALVLREPIDEHIQACPLTRDIPGFRTKLAGWRLSLRLQVARLFTSGEMDEYYGDAGQPTLLTAGLDNKALFILMEKKAAYGAFQWWDMRGTVLSRNHVEAPWEPVGTFAGDYLIPYDNGSFSPPEHLLACFDDEGDYELFRVWQVLQNYYISRAGYSEYGEWVNDDEGSGLVNLHYWEPHTSPKAGSLPLTLELIVLAFQEGCTDSWDASWKRFGMPDEDDYLEDFDESIYDFPAIGVVFLPQPGAGNFGTSIWDGQHDEATCQVLRVGGERLGRGARRNPYMSQERSGLLWELLESVNSLSADFIVYDPNEPI